MKLLASLMIAMLSMNMLAQDKVIALYDGPVPGSEDWKQVEKENNKNAWNTRIVFNVAPQAPVLLGSRGV